MQESIGDVALICRLSKYISSAAQAVSIQTDVKVVQEMSADRCAERTYALCQRHELLLERPSFRGSARYRDLDRTSSRVRG